MLRTILATALLFGSALVLGQGGAQPQRRDIGNFIPCDGTIPGLMVVALDPLDDDDCTGGSGTAAEHDCICNAATTTYLSSGDRLASIFLKLDASNEPITAPLQIEDTGAVLQRTMLDLVNNGSIRLNLVRSDTADVFSIRNNAGALQIHNVASGAGNIFNIDLTTGDVEMTGDVGIGTTSPEVALEVAGSTGILIDNDAAYKGEDAGGGNRNLLLVDTGDNLQIGSTSLDDIRFDVGGVDDAMTIEDVTGDVGIRTVSPDGTLHVHTATAGSVSAFAASDDLVVEAGGNGGISVLTPDADFSALHFGSPGDSVGARLDWNYSSNKFFMTTDRVGATITFGADAGSEDMLLHADGGLTIGAPTGGSKGSGTLNAKSVYDDGTILTDHVFCQLGSGWATSEFCKNHGDERGMQDGIYTQMPLDDVREFVGDKGHLPWVPGYLDWGFSGKPSNGEQLTHLLEALENSMLYILDLEERLTALEAR